MLFRSDTPAIPSHYHDVLVLGGLYHALRSDGRDQESVVIYREWIDRLKRAKAELQKKQRDSFLFIDEPFGSGYGY